jgi:hypothetical protein
MRVTPNVVHTIAAHAETFTDGAFRFQGVGGDLGYGARYIDGVRQLVWLGRGGSRQAAAYYIGGMLGWARSTGAMIPDDVREYCQPVQEAYTYDRKAMASQQDGENDAEARAAARLADAPKGPESYGTIWVCTDCLMHHANGECGSCHDDEHGHDEEPLSSIGEGFHVAMGMSYEEHDESCERHTKGSDAADDHECDCETRTYSTSQCEGCGSYLHGERHAMTLFKG